MRRLIINGGLLAILMAVANVGQAGMISETLGNGSSGLVDGTVYGVAGPSPNILEAQAGQPAPFDAGKGNELFGPSLSESWMFSYAAITPGTVLSASLTLGIFDHDSAASGSQVSLYSIDGNGLTTELDALFEAGGGSGDSTYNEYTISLGAGLFGDLEDGTATIQLDLAGPGLQTALIGGAVTETSFNGAHLIFSTLTIETEDEVVPEVPTPPALALALLGFGMMAGRRRRGRPVA